MRDVLGLRWSHRLVAARVETSLSQRDLSV